MKMKNLYSLLLVVATTGGARDPHLHADGHTGDAAYHSRLHDLRVLDLWWKAARGRRLSLSRKGDAFARMNDPNRS